MAQWLGYNILEEMIAQVLSIYMDRSLILLQIVLMSCPCSFSVAMYDSGCCTKHKRLYLKLEFNNS